MRAQLAAIIVMTTCATSAMASAEAWQEAGQIHRAAEALIRSVAPENTRLRITPLALDPRLRLARCDRPLEAFFNDPGRLSSNTTIGVRCAAPRPWRIFVPVRIAQFQTVVVARRSLARGARIAKDDLTLEERDIGRLGYGFFQLPKNVVGQRLTRALQAGAVVSPSMVAAPNLIRRGQTVTILARNKGIQVRMIGRAMMDGRGDQRIKVLNLSSQRELEAVVRSAQLVEVLLY